MNAQHKSSFYKFVEGPERGWGGKSKFGPPNFSFPRSPPAKVVQMKLLLINKNFVQQ